MKKKSLIIFLIILILIVACTTTEKLAMSTLYTVTSKDYKDIRGNFTIDTFLLYKVIAWGSNDVITFERVKSEQVGLYYRLTVRFIGPDWRFMEEIHIKTDNNLYSLKDKSPSRDVLSGYSNVTVQEIISVVLEPAIIDDLKKTNTLKIQYFASPIIIPNEGIDAAHKFLAE